MIVEIGHHNGFWVRLMAKRYTDTEKWEDPWYHKLSPPAKLLFNYLCDQCDLAGFWEINVEMATFKIGYPPETIEGALEELKRCYETNGTYLWITRFIGFQGNYPLNEKNMAHLGILRMLRERERFSENITRLLNGKGLPSSYEGANKGLFRPISKGQGQGLKEKKRKDLKASMSQRVKDSKPPLFLSGKTLKQKAKEANFLLKTEIWPRLKELQKKAKLTKKEIEEQKMLEGQEAYLVDGLDTGRW